MSTRERFIDRFEALADEGIALCDAIKYRGGYTAEDQAMLDKIEGSRVSVILHSYQIAAEMEGKRVPDRTNIPVDSRERRGLFIENKGERKSLYVYGGIGESHGGITAEDFRERLSEISPRTSFDLHVHSPGGSFHDGVSIHNQIRDRPGAVYGFVDGLAASAGSLILMGCETVTMPPGSQMMLHYASLNTEGSLDESDLTRMLRVIKETNSALIDLYLPRWKSTREELDAALKEETYYSPRQAIEAGLADFESDMVKVAAYATESYRKKPTFAISAEAKTTDGLGMRRAKFVLWKLLADDMRREG